MKHQAHLFVPGDWVTDTLQVPRASAAHLNKVLRYPDGGIVTYTDGYGRVGGGRWVDSAIERGPERLKPRITDLTIAVAPPKQRDRARFVVEKAQELGVAKLIWLNTDHTVGQPPSDSKVDAWLTGALEQSQGAWRTQVSGPATLADLDDPILCDATGRDFPGDDRTATATVAVGPEGGWSESELAGRPTVSLGPTTLRVETAVVAAAALFLHRQRQGDSIALPEALA
ncbi:MAG: RsmE family RNA methyltransferase [Armatimonadetes bacterium]|nr:MAG: RsmE family RNA methyltransferase [Armatimonadota bacterium]